MPGLPSDPDFLTNLQTFFMQVLTTYTSLVPALRAELLVLPDDSSFAAVAAAVFWTALLAVATLTLNVASVALYTYRAPLAPLLSFFGSVVQATAVLQLATRFGSHDVPVDEGVELAAGV